MTLFRGSPRPATANASASLLPNVDIYQCATMVMYLVRPTSRAKTY